MNPRPRFFASARAAALWALAGVLARPAAAAEGGRCHLVKDGYGPAGTAQVRAETVASGLEVPWAIGFLPSGDMLVTERPGRLRLVAGGKLLNEPVARVAVSARSEAGLLGLAVDPRFRENRAFYLYQTAEDGRSNRVSRWVLSPDGRSAREEKIILDGIPAARFHDGGRIHFGPDGMLYVGTGDAGSPGRALEPGSLSGKLLRVDREGRPAPDNPRPGSPVFVLGIRNLEAFDWLDPKTLVLAEHGPSGEMGRSGHDRVSAVKGGDSLGWPEVYGCQTGPGFAEPLLSWENAMPPGGGAVYSGDAIPGWKGSFLVGALGSRRLLRVEVGPDHRLRSFETYFEGDPPRGLGRVREVAMGPDGQLYITTSNCDGRGTCPREKDRIVRVVPAAAPAPAAPTGR